MYFSTLYRREVFHFYDVNPIQMNALKKQKPGQDRLRQIPSVDVILSKISGKIPNLPYSLVRSSIRNFLAEIRESIIKGHSGTLTPDFIIGQVVKQINHDHSSKLINIINGTGIILHTGLGRAPFSKAIMEDVCTKTTGYINLELDLTTANRSERSGIVRELIQSLTGAESSLVVNNNAAAVLLMLNTIAEGKEVIVSRGQQVEIGGSFRIPDVILKSGCILKEVGTTNKTHLKDYQNAVTDQTAAILVVHTSNFKIEGFIHQVEFRDLSGWCKKKRIPLLMDLGSGAIANLTQLGLPREPQVCEFIRGGATIVTFSGDKLLGGPQAGIICGKKSIVNKLQKNPLYRALRVDKMTHAILDETLRTYLKPTDIHPNNLTLWLLQRTPQDLVLVAGEILDPIDNAILTEHGIHISPSYVEAGSGSLPTEKIPSMAIVFSPQDRSAADLAYRFRNLDTPVLGYISGNRFRIDLKAVLPGQESLITAAILSLVK